MTQRNRTRRAAAPVLGLVAATTLAMLGIGSADVGRAAAAPQVAPPTAGVEAVVPAVDSAPAAVPAVATEPPASLRGGSLVERLGEAAPELDRKVLQLAVDARERALSKGLVERPDLLTVIDYSLPSTQERLWVFDIAKGKVLFHELVAHGKNTGDNYATRFSNRDGSLQTSLGLFVTSGTYQGGNGYSLKLRGLDRGFNDNAMARAVVMHGAPYVSREFARQHGRIGRSWGCPALSRTVAPKVIDTIKGGSVVFSYYPEKDWLASSAFLSRAAVDLAVAAAR